MTRRKGASPEDRLIWLSEACRWMKLHWEEAMPSSRLSAEALQDAVFSSLPTEGELREALNQLARSRPIGEVALILPNNVETAIVRPLFWSILGRNNTRVKLPSRGSGVSQLVLTALRETNPALASSISSWRFNRKDDSTLLDFVRDVDAVHVLGRDETVEAVQSLGSRARVVAHGSGLGLVVLPADAVSEELASRIALDVARHDQRGCLSPHALIVDGGSNSEALAWAHALDEALRRVGEKMPRGVLSTEELSAERTWRDVALATGELFASATHAVSVEEHAPRDCPGVRNIAVHPMKRAAVDALVGKLGTHLKCIGALEGEATAAMRARFPQASDVVALGTMQTPRLGAPMDGVAPHTGFALF